MNYYYIFIRPINHFLLHSTRKQTSSDLQCSRVRLRIICIDLKNNYIINLMSAENSYVCYVAYIVMNNLEI